MKSFRLTLISDPTEEHPKNKNNNFKVRLPVRLNLEGNNWQASLWSVSVPDVGHSSAVIHSNSDTKILNYRWCHWLHQMGPCWSYPPAKRSLPLVFNTYKRDPVLWKHHHYDKQQVRRITDTLSYPHYVWERVYARFGEISGTQCSTLDWAWITCL